MSTILEALRKSRTEPPQESVEPRQEVLSSQTHNYLATVPGAPHNEILILRRVIYGTLAMIILLLLVVVALLFRQHDRSQQQPVVAAAPKQKAMPAVKPNSTPADVEHSIQISIPTPMASPTETPLPPPSPFPAMMDAEAEEAAVLERAARLRAESVSRPEPVIRRPRRYQDDSGSIQDVRISGIVWDSQSPVAMVDGKVIRPGSTVRGSKVVKINKDSIVFLVDGREVTLRQ